MSASKMGTGGGKLPGVQAHQLIRQKILNPFNTEATVGTVGKYFSAEDKPGLEIKGSNKKAAVLKPLLAA